MNPTAGPACAGQNLQLNGGNNAGAGALYAWTGPNGFTSGAQDPVINGITNAAAGTYSFTVTSAAPANCVSATGTVNVSVGASPTISVPASATPNPICAGGSTQLSVTGTGVGYSVATTSYAPTSGTGAAGPAGDDAVLTVPIGFPFSFYGASYTNAVISTNGFISFDAASGNGCCSGQVIPTDVNTPNN
ncbi:MAG: hypothetical protein IPO87_16870 [Flavobacteriales bacterium]|nr:hypothetical protein [Flavobacteriales bacterium]